MAPKYGYQGDANKPAVQNYHYKNQYQNKFKPQ